MGRSRSRSPAPNGSGKSTLLAALLGRIPLDAGSAALGPGVVVGEVDQARGALPRRAPLLEAFGAAVPDMLPADVRTLLAKFGLRGRPRRSARPRRCRPASARAPALALLQASGVNLLVLDEPTNHLDLPAIEQLESALDAYDGTLLLVTHDRRMLEAVATNRRLDVDDGHVRER